jgi:spermidine/putrescine transport system permease protein
MSGTVVRAPAGETRGASRAAGRGPVGWWRDPWRRPRVLASMTWVFLLWSIAPVAIAILFSFNAGRANDVWQGFSMRWYYGDPVLSVWHDPDLHAELIQTLRLGILTTAIALPIGIAFAIGIHRWRGPLSSSFNFLMVLSFVMPELIIGVALLLVFTNLLTAIKLGTMAQLLGLVTFEVSYPVIIVRARLTSIGKQYEEAAMDLGASPTGALWRVTMPLLYPAIFASAVLVFASVIDDFVIVRYLSSTVSTQTMSIEIYNSARSTPTPALNALATIMLVISFLAVGLGFFAYRWLTRGERQGEDVSATKDLALQI